jgi:hypothetical protein
MFPCSIFKMGYLILLSSQCYKAFLNVIKLLLGITLVKVVGKYKLCQKSFIILASVPNIKKLFTAVITPLAAYFSMILTELCR